MEKTKRNFNIYVIGSLAATLVCVVLRTLSVFMFYDLEIGYYTRGAALPIALNILLVLSVALFAIGAILLTKERRFEPKANSQAVRYVSVLPFGAFLAFVANAVNKLMAYSSRNAELEPTFYVALVCAVLGAIWFATVALDKSGNAIGLALGFAVIVWFIVSLAISYFDPYVQMNSPDKLIFHMACLSGMLLVLGELRRYFSTPRKALYMFSLSAASLLLLTSSVPSILVSTMGRGLHNYVLLAEDGVCLGVGIFALVKLISIAFLEKIPEAEDAEVAEESAETAESEAEESEAADDER